RVAGEIQDHPFRLWRDGGIEVFGPQLEAAVLRAPHDHRHAARELHHLGVAYPARYRHDDLVARIDRRHQRIEDRLLTAVGHNDFVDRIVEIIVSLELA